MCIIHIWTLITNIVSGKNKIVMLYFSTIKKIQLWKSLTSAQEDQMKMKEKRGGKKTGKESGKTKIKNIYIYIYTYNL